MLRFKNHHCFSLFLPFLLPSILLAFASTNIASVANADEGWVAGAAKRDITPTESIRLSGYAARSKPTFDISDKLHARALFMKNGDSKPLMLVSIDAIGVAPWMTQTIAEQASRELGLARSQIAICSTHSHSAPHLEGALTNLFSAPLDESETKAIKNYSKNLVTQILDAMRDAVASAKPAKLQEKNWRWLINMRAIAHRSRQSLIALAATGQGFLRRNSNQKIPVSLRCRSSVPEPMRIRIHVATTSTLSVMVMS